MGRVNDEGGARGDGLRVYAGLRADPFFVDVPAVIESLETGRLAFKDVGTNSVNGFNLLSIVIEADTRPLLAEWVASTHHQPSGNPRIQPRP